MAVGSKTATIAVLVTAIVLGVVVFLILYFLTKGPAANKPLCTKDSDCGSGKTCKNEACVDGGSCAGGPARPTNVATTYDSLLSDVTVTWAAVSSATGYNVYRKAEDPSVSKGNKDQVVSVTATSYTFTGLDAGTHYFCVTATNECGESDESVSYSYAALCFGLPSTPVAPTITTDTDNCADPPAAEFVNIDFEYASGTNPFNIIEGNGQVGIDNAFLLIEGANSPTGVALNCTGAPVAYTSISIADGAYANLLTPTGPEVLGATLFFQWQPVLGAEEYAVFAGSDDGLKPAFFGTTVAAPNTSCTINAPAGYSTFIAYVVGYKLCDKSVRSDPGYHLALTGP